MAAKIDPKPGPSLNAAPFTPIDICTGISAWASFNPQAAEKEKSFSPIAPVEDE